MSSGMNRFQQIYETAFTAALTAKNDDIKETVIDFGNRITNALEFSEWKLGNISEKIEGNRIQIDNKGGILVDNEGKIQFEIRWSIDISFSGKGKSLNVGCTFFLISENGIYMATTAENPNVKWDFRDEQMLRNQADIVIEMLSRSIANLGTNDGRRAALSNRIHGR